MAPQPTINAIQSGDIKQMLSSNKMDSAWKYKEGEVRQSIMAEGGAT